MVALLCFFLTLFASSFKSKSRLEAENAALRHQQSAALTKYSDLQSVAYLRPLFFANSTPANRPVLFSNPSPSPRFSVVHSAQFLCWSDLANANPQISYWSARTAHPRKQSQCPGRLL